jgi:hypothetical protein
MALKLPKAGAAYAQQVAAKTNQYLEQADTNNRKKGSDVELSTERLILRSPSGARWAITVSNTGVVGATAL